MRESPALDVMGLLHAKGAQVAYADPLRAGGARPRVAGPLRHQGASRSTRGIVRAVRLRRHRHRPQGVRLRRDGRRSGPDRRHAQRDQASRHPHVFKLGAPRPDGAAKARHRIGTLGAAVVDLATAMAMESSSGSRSLLVAYVYAGYPLLLAVWARLARSAGPRSVVPGRGESWPSISIILAARNEARAAAGAHRQPPDQSLPRSARDHRRLRRLDRRHRGGASRPFGDRDSARSRCRRGGKPLALNAGVAAATGDILVFADARQRFAADALAAARGQLRRSRSRRRHRRADPRLRIDERRRTRAIGDGVGLYWKYEKWLRRHESRVWSTLGATGAIYALRRSLWRRCRPDTLLDDVLAPMRAVLAG